MKTLRALALVACVLIPASAGAADVHGAWTATTDSRDRIHLQMSTGQWMNFGESFNLSELGLSPSVVQASTMTPVTIKLDREAGTLVVEGTFKNGDGAGQFTFTANRNFLAGLRSIGIENDLPGERPEAQQLFTLALMDVTLAYARSIRSIFPDATLRDIRKARAVGVTPEYVASLRALGLDITTVHDAAKLAGVEVTPEYIRAMRAAGVEIHDVHDATRLKGVNVTPEFVAELARAGYTNLSTRDLVRAAAVGVDGDFIRKFSKYKNKQ